MVFFGRKKTPSEELFTLITNDGLADRMLMDHNFSWPVETMYVGIKQPQFVNEIDFDDETAKKLSAMRINKKQITSVFDKWGLC